MSQRWIDDDYDYDDDYEHEHEHEYGSLSLAGEHSIPADKVPNPFPKNHPIPRPGSGYLNVLAENLALSRNNLCFPLIAGRQ